MGEIRDGQEEKLNSGLMSQAHYTTDFHVPSVEQLVMDAKLPFDYEVLVKAFHDKYGHYSGSRLETHIPNSIRNLRKRLIFEESKEFLFASDENDIVLLADAIGDLLYVTFGAAIAYGIDTKAVFREIHRSNMTKSTAKDINGKTVKGPEYSPPNIYDILFGKKEVVTLTPEAESLNPNVAVENG